MNEQVRELVEGADQVLVIGELMTDLNTGAFTARLNPKRTVTIGHHQLQVNDGALLSVEMGDILTELARRLPKRKLTRIKPTSVAPFVGNGDDCISAEALYPRWARFIRPDDILIAESGTASYGLLFALMPLGATFHSQTQWGSIGWATPAAFGAAIAAPGRRVVLVTGEGAHQLTAQEISQFGRLGLKPIVFLLNNNGYLIERMFCKEPGIAYNDIAQWRYAELPRVLGCDGWFTARVTTCGEFDAALERALNANTGVYIEVVTDTYAAPELMLKLHDAVKVLYKQ